MPGLLEEAQMTETSPAGEETMATETVQQETPDQPATGLDVSDEAAPVLEQAVNMAYSEENFPKMVKMFQESGTEGFPQAMALAVSGVMDRVEKDGQLPEQLLAEVGGSLFEMIAEDMIEGAQIQGVTSEVLMQAMGQTLNMWAENNPDRFDKEAFAQAIQEEVQAEDVAGVEAAPAAAEPTQGLLSEMA